MNFIEYLKENNDLDLYTHPSCLRPLNHILVKKGIRFSIQAGYGMYCTPRKTLVDLTGYTSMEFALIDGDDFVSVESAFPNYPRLGELEPYFEGSVYAYVPVELIEDLYFHIREGI